MRRLIFQNMVSIDGYFEGQNKDISWHNVDAEFNDYAIEVLSSIDLLLFGRVTYELMASFWPTIEATTNDPIVAGYMNKIKKIVVSKTLTYETWNNTTIIKDNIAGKILELKKAEGKDIAVFGSSDLASTLIQNNLIDEYRIFVNPVVLGSGKSLFNGIKNRFRLKLLYSKTFKSGNVLLCYVPQDNSYISIH